MPARGSLQDRVICEVLTREKRRHISENVYLGRILAAGMQLPEQVFQLWTALLTMEVSQENYFPGTSEAKKVALRALTEGVKEHSDKRVHMFKKLHKLTVGEDDLRPASPEEKEAFRRKLRRRHLKYNKK